MSPRYPVRSLRSRDRVKRCDLDSVILLAVIVGNKREAFVLESGASNSAFLKKDWIASSLTLPCTNASRLLQAMTI